MATSYGSAGLFVKLEGNLFIKDYGTKVVRDAVKKTSRQAVSILQSVTPVDSGYLRSRWKASINSFTDYRLDTVTNDTFYGVFVDEGTRFQRAQHFTDKGKKLIEDDFLNNLEVAVDKLKK